MDAPKGQQLTAQGTALGFCVAVGFFALVGIFALKVQKLLPLQGGHPLASYNPGRCPGLVADGLSGRCEHPCVCPNKKGRFARNFSKSIPKSFKMGAPKGQQLTAQGTALGFCVGVGIIKGVSKF